MAGTNFSLSTSDKHTVDFNKNVMSVDGVVQREFDYAAFSSGYTLYLFSDNRGGTANETMKGRILAFQYYDNGTLKHDYRPCIDNNDVACLYDEVSKSYKYGVGTFTAGESITGGSTAGNIPVTITGTGDADYCYAIISGTKYTSAQTVTTKEGNKITLGIYSGGSYAATITINSTAVLKTFDGAQTYEWEVPSGCAGISIKFTVDYSRSYSNIAITTE